MFRRVALERSSSNRKLFNSFERTAQCGLLSCMSAITLYSSQRRTALALHQDHEHKPDRRVPMLDEPQESFSQGHERPALRQSSLCRDRNDQTRDARLHQTCRGREAFLQLRFAEVLSLIRDCDPTSR